MGLTIHIQLRLPHSLAPRAVEAMVRGVHDRAERMVTRRSLTRIGPVEPATEDPQCVHWLTIKTGLFDFTGIEVQPTEGWCFSVHPGEGCESALFGLCRYPSTVAVGRSPRRRTRIGSGWSLASFCKTQYAALKGWDHFLHCHRAVIDLALLWEAMGVSVSIVDEGEYWPGRDVRTLRERLGAYDRSVAALAGALKDDAEESGSAPVQAPILAHPQFERLEAEGAEGHAAQLDAARQEIRKARRRTDPK